MVLYWMLATLVAISLLLAVWLYPGAKDRAKAEESTADGLLTGKGPDKEPPNHTS